MKHAETAPPIGGFEINEGPGEKVRFFIDKIKSVKQKIERRFGVSGEKSVEMTDEALTYNAKETINAADEDGERSASEQQEIRDAVSTVIVEGAMEESGAVRSSGDNPIIALDQEIPAADIADSIRDFSEKEATLPSGDSVAELAINVLERAENPPRLGLGETIAQLRSREFDRSGETIYRPRTEVICDRDHIEGQRIDIINKKDKNITEISFKLREMPQIAENGFTSSGIQTREGKMNYDSATNDKEATLTKARIFEKNGIKISIASDATMRAALGLVRAEAPSDMAPDEIEQALSSIMAEDFGVSDALGEVSGESEHDYKCARLAWQHKLDTAALTAEQAEAAEKLVREEVFPGYSTFVEKGKHKEYAEKYGNIRAIHELGSNSPSSIIRILTSGGMCSTERYRRGVIQSGISTAEDFRSGGADSFFTRVRSEQALEHLSPYVSTIVFKPELFDRTDWYSYDADRFGTTSESKFTSRLSPDELFQKVKDGSIMSNNEQMFRTGIGPKYIDKIVVPQWECSKILAALKEAGMVEFNGRPIEEVVVPNPEEG